MKNVLAMFALLMVYTASSQQAMNFERAQELGISFNELDERYTPGMSNNPQVGAFNDRSDDYLIAYQSFLQELMLYLSENDLVWDKPVRCFNRIYFNDNGQVDHFFYNFKEGEISTHDEQKFKKLLKEFIKEARFGLDPGQAFSQCSPVVYRQH